MKKFGAIETGGTKFVCAIGTESGEIEKKIVIPTTTPDETMPQVIQFFTKEHKKHPLSGIGIACFGPIDINKKSIHFGMITTTPKLAWRNYDFYGVMKKHFSIPIAFDLDVNGSALGEQNWGNAKGCDTFIYMTVGTGIGVGGIVSNNLMHGMTHPEMGHIFVPTVYEDSFKGICPTHGSCLEGMASGPALMKRWNVKTAMDLPDDHLGWDYEAHYLGYAIANYILCISPEKIILGGGVMKQKHLFPKIRKKVQNVLNGYVHHKNILKNINDYIVKPGLGDNSGICGAVALAKRKIQTKSK